MSKEIYISSTPHETRLAIVEKEELSEIYYERENEYTLAGSIYNGRVTRVLPGMQSAFVDVGLERDAFLYITDFLEEQGEDSAEFEGGGGEPRRESRDRNGDRGGDRNGRRGDRDRNGRGREQAPRESADEQGYAAQPVLAEPDAGEAGLAGASDGGDEGAEGSRRWRGRRGRRRGGRSGEARGPVAEGETLPAIDEEPVSEDEIASGSVESVFGQAEEAPRETSRDDRGRGGRERDDRGGDRGGRGGRDRDRFGDRDRGRERRPERSSERGADAGGGGLPPGVEPLILPGESLSRYRRGDDAQTPEANAASVAAKPKPSYLTARPSTEIDLSVAAWDGGFTLPGESLSRRRGPSEAAPAAGNAAERALEQEFESGNGRGSDRRRDRDRKRGRSGRSDDGSSYRESSAAAPAASTEEATPDSFRSGAVLHENLDPREAAQPGVSSEHEPEASTIRVDESL
ncbi:MAG TPA: hypothetical protein VKV02_09170, partial [Acidobacteriaceae bacterium]|nr:hypothetical protein [Acidobacteriaceae bacterium]